MDAFGAILIVAGAVAAIATLLTSTPAMTFGVTIFAGVTAAAVLIGCGAMLVTLAQMRAALRELVVFARDDAEFRKASWQRQGGTLGQAVPPPEAFAPPPGQAPLPTKLELQDRHGTELGANLFIVMQQAAQRGAPLTETDALPIAQRVQGRAG